MREATTVEAWAEAYLRSTSLAEKLAPPPAPDRFADAPAPVRIAAPGRPPELVPAAKRARTPSVEALRDPRKRVELLHVFLHHELQAAELMLWALLAFADAPAAFRRGLLKIAHDEIRHAALYEAHLRALGGRYGQHPIRDWFWERVPTVQDPAGFVALLGVGFEGANLDHATRFAERFHEVGDVEGARLQELVRDEEIPHVRFALHWFERFTGAPLAFEAWRAKLPAPLSPIVARGRPLAREARLRAGLDAAFVDALDAYEP